MNILICGGAGFIGSNLALSLVKQKHNVTIIDGLFENTGGNITNLTETNKCHFINKPIEEVDLLNQLLKSNDVVIDCMGWTSHSDAFLIPQYDLELNLKSHLHLIQHLQPNNKVIYLGSIGQFGKTNAEILNNDCPFNPTDVQGVHKAAAEQLFRAFSTKHGFTVFAIRLPNVFGQKQKFNGADIGLVNSFIRSAINEKEIVVFGANRFRTLLYINDLVTLLSFAIQQISNFSGFRAYNISGIHIPIRQLAEEISSIIGGVKINFKPLPGSIAAIDNGGIKINDAVFKTEIYNYSNSPLSLSLSQTIKYYHI